MIKAGKMKVDPIRGSGKGAGPKRRRQVKELAGSSFKDVLKSAGQERNIELEDLFDEIEESGRNLKENPRLENFKNYRERVARFIKLFLEQSYEVKLTSEMTLTGRQRYLVLSKKIDVKLEEMYHLFLQEMFDVEEMFKGMEEVRGMLLDLYR